MSWHEMLNVILLNLRTIVKVTILSTIFLFIILLFIYPRTYQATVSILPPEQENSLGGFGALLGNGDFSNLLGGGLSSASSQLFVEILKSRTAALYVVRRNNLVKFFNAEDDIESAEKLQKNLNTDISKEGIVNINVDVKSAFLPLIFSDSDSLKRLSAVLSNSFVEALDSINREKLSSKARNARVYIEGQIKETKILLDSAETALMNFQSKNKTIAIPEQVKAAIDASAQIKSEIIQTEIQLGLVKSDVSESSRLVLALNKKLQELKEQYSQFENGSEDYLLAFKDLPTLGKNLAGLLREVRIQNEVYVLLQQQYYKEKIQENKEIPTIEILDEAIPPKKPVAPRVIFSSVMGGFLIFVLISLFVVGKSSNLARKKVHK
jgi:tyrosine-protein kinase Etk/Wzc